MVFFVTQYHVYNYTSTQESTNERNSRKVRFKQFLPLIKSSAINVTSNHMSAHWALRFLRRRKKSAVSLSADFCYTSKLQVCKFQVTPLCENKMLFTKCKRLCRLLSLLDTRICTRNKVQYTVNSLTCHYAHWRADGNHVMPCIYCILLLNILHKKVKKWKYYIKCCSRCQVFNYFFKPLTPELNSSAQRYLTRYFTGNFASRTVHFVKICLKTQ
jgi:hypothetical protein